MRVEAVEKRIAQEDGKWIVYNEAGTRSFGSYDSKEESEDGVRILSMHSSKGLEFPNVFICCCEDGVIPHRRSIDENPENMDEERRLFYVAMTRAEDRLVLTFSIFDSKKYRLPKKPSRFLFESVIVSTDELQEQFQELMSKRI
jgi:DNA helicase-2/ATP-dependent DNA helicase PcrA